MTEPDPDIAPVSNKAIHLQRHLRFKEAEPWVKRFAPLVRGDGSVLDLACGNGRHGRLFLDRGHSVTFLDRDTSAVVELVGHPRAEIVTFDLEQNEPWPLSDRRFAAVIVVNYLWRLLFPDLIQALATDGVLLYDTFARGNERFASPRNPEHLLRAGELLNMARGALTVIAYEHGRVDRAECPGVKQRICAVKARSDPTRDDGEPAPVSVEP